MTIHACSRNPRPRRVSSKLEELFEGHYYITKPSWTFGLDDEENRQFGVYIEAMNMLDATGEKEFEDYPYVVSFAIVADDPHPDFAESDENRSDRLRLIADAMSYMGGVPIDHDLIEAIVGGRERSRDAWKNLVSLFTPEEAMVRRVAHQYGTIAAQRGPGSEFKYLQFKDEAAARKYIDYIVTHRLDALGTMIGFILDRPINMAGNTGWETMEGWIKGKNRDRRGNPGKWEPDASDLYDYSQNVEGLYRMTQRVRDSRGALEAAETIIEDYNAANASMPERLYKGTAKELAEVIIDNEVEESEREDEKEQLLRRR